MNTQTVMLGNLITRGLQVRCAMNGDVVAEYAEAMKDGAKFPPIIAYREATGGSAAGSSSGKDRLPTADAPTTKLYLADGYHRVEAAREVGLIEIEAEVRDGGYNEALRFALQANATHGLRLTNADKRRALDLAWQNRDKLFRTFLGQNKDGKPNGLPSSNQLALMTGVSQRRALNYIIGTDAYRAAEASAPETEGVKSNLARGLDRFGMPIPPNLLEVFRDASSLRKLARQVRDVKDAISEGMSGNMLFAAIPQQTIINLDNAMHEILHGRPYSVCRCCAGKGCYRCNDTGFLTRTKYNAIPDEYKAHDEPADISEED